MSLSHLKTFVLILLYISISYAQSEYILPIYYDLEEQYNSTEKISFSYKVIDTKEKIKIGNFLLTSKSLQSFIKTNSNGSSKSIMLTWSQGFFQPDQIAFYNNENDKPIQVQDIKNQIKANRIIIKNFEKIEAAISNKEASRVCLKESRDDHFTELCIPIYKTQLQDYSFIVNENPVQKNEDEIPIKMGQEIHIQTHLGSGLSLNQFIAPRKLELVEIVDLGFKNNIRLVGTGTKPFFATDIDGIKDRLKWLKDLKIEDPNRSNINFWTYSINKGVNSIFLPGLGGGIFKYTFVINDVLPSEKFKIRISNKTPTESYLNEPTINFQAKNFNHSITTNQLKIEKSELDPSIYNWTIQNNNPGFYNRSYFSIKQSDNENSKYYPFFDIYRGYANELSCRLSGMTVQAALGFVGEFSANHWFENIFGINNSKYLSQRVGISLKYFQSLTPFIISPTKTMSFDSLNIDLKYRFTPGVILHKESMGAILSYLNLDFGPYTVPMTGVGWFWARSFPQPLEFLFNWASIFRYQKYVDMEMLYYLQSLDSAYTISNVFAINFHGQILWTKNIFGEAGFGYKNYNFRQSNGTGGNFGSLYGTVGLGMRF